MKAYFSPLAVAILIALTTCPLFAHGESPRIGSTGSKLQASLGTYPFPITTDSPEAQAWFNQGLVLLFGFNHGEAIRALPKPPPWIPKPPWPGGVLRTPTACTSMFRT